MAENQENLQHILVFLTVTGALPGVDLEAEREVGAVEIDETGQTEGAEVSESRVESRR